MADYMWITNPRGGGLSFNVVEGGSQTVDIDINFFVTYCRSWPSDTSAKGLNFGVSQPGSWNRLSAAPVQIKYGNRTKPGFREEWGTYQTGAKLDLSGLATGDYWMCTSFSSSSVHAVINEPSASACFWVHVNRVQPWETSGWSRVGVGVGGKVQEPNVTQWSATPGDRLYWRHGVYNDGPGTTSQIAFAINKSGFSNGWNGVWDPGAAARFQLNSGRTYEVGYNRAWDWYSVYDVQQQDVGNRLCESISWGPWKWNDGAWRNSGDWTGVFGGACVNIPYNFRLTSRVDVPTTAAESGSSVTVTPSIENSGPTKSYDDTRWQLSKFILAPGASIPSASESGNPCAPSWPRCSKVNEGAGTFPPSTTTLAQSTYTVEDLPLGSQVCFGLSVNKFSAGKGAGNWWNGTPDCMVVGKKPKVQVWGGDAAVRGTIRTSTTTKDGKVFGSWVEYGALSVGANNLFASGAGLVDESSTSQTAWSALTFANVATGRTPPFGYYAQNAGSFRPLPDISGYFSALQNTQPYDAGKSLNENSFATGESVVVRTGASIDLDQQTLNKERSVVIVATQKVTIKGNINYESAGLTNVRDIPQLVIIAPAIDIEGRVSNVDAWLIASGAVNTCSDESIDPGTGAVALAGGICDDILTVNGPVVANKLLLYRTGGSGTGADSGTPAETFKLRPDAYLWAQLVATGSGKAQTVYTVELPPRF